MVDDRLEEMSKWIENDNAGCKVDPLSDDMELRLAALEEAARRVAEHDDFCGVGTDLHLKIEYLRDILNCQQEPSLNEDTDTK